ncbi:serpin family protein [Nanoarchaeota archaeon]
MKQTTILAIILALLIIGCGGPEPIKVDDSQATPETAQSVVQANNQYAFELYSQIKKESAENIFYSPFSISTALAMTYEGAKGQTAEEMQNVFHFPIDDLTRRSGYAKVINQINKKDKKYKLHTANALWAEQNYQFLPEYINVNKQYYGGEITNLDFKNNPSGSKDIINKWVEDQTNNKIKNILSSLSPLTRLVLTNAIYFKGKWDVEFEESRTKKQDFEITADNTIKVDMMNLAGEDAEFPYTEDDDFQILELPYKGKEVSMVIMLPKENNISKLDKIDAEKLSEWRNSLREQQIILSMPKFKFETKYSMGKTLSDMGMPTAFSKDADFSGMDGTKLLMIDQVIHQAFVEVNEEGTEAAAATAVIMIKEAVSMDRPIIFNADHPFMFIIHEKETGTILFMGRVVDPRE